MIQFILGALAGALAAWWWRGDIQHYVDDRLPRVRRQAADRLSAIEQRAEEALGRAKDTIERIRPSDEQSHAREMSAGRQPGNYTHGTGV
jgi:hypothetical protein